MDARWNGKLRLETTPFKCTQKEIGRADKDSYIRVSNYGKKIAKRKIKKSRDVQLTFAHDCIDLEDIGTQSCILRRCSLRFFFRNLWEELLNVICNLDRIRCGLVHECDTFKCVCR